MSRDGVGRVLERSDDPGVPEAVPRTLSEIADRLDVAMMDRVWVFPPLKRGRKESGLVVVSLHMDDDTERRRLVTISYAAERRGLELMLDSTYTEEGQAPPDMLPRVMEGVVRRAGEDHTAAREVEVERTPELFQDLLDEFDPKLFAPKPQVEPEADNGVSKVGPESGGALAAGSPSEQDDPRAVTMDPP